MEIRGGQGREAGQGSSSEAISMESQGRVSREAREESEIRPGGGKRREAREESEIRPGGPELLLS